jgi:ribosomal protein S8
VLENVIPHLYDGITTKKIYKIAFKELRNIDNPTASRYQLKWAIMRLGEGFQGFSFEKYVGKVFEKLGYETKLNVIAKGKYIDHEIDLEVEKDGKKYLVECKHRSKPGIWIHVQVPLYVYARYLDLKHKYDGAIVVTNARFSKQAVAYAKGVGLRLIGWDLPKNDSLKDLAEKSLVYPLTVLKSVDDKSLRKLLDVELIVVSDIIDNPKFMEDILGKKKALQVIEEAKKLKDEQNHKK